MNNLKISKDIKNIIIKYTLPPINKIEFNDEFKYNIETIKNCLNAKFVYLNNGHPSMYVKNFNGVKYKHVTTVLNSYWTLRLKTDL
jgi:hypothetical protein